MDDSSKLAFQFARDLTTQLITLSSGILALSITFNKEVIKTAPKSFGWALWMAWVFLLLSIVGGVWTTQALIGTLEQKQGSFEFNVRLPAALQIISFGLGLVLLMVYGVAALFQQTRALAKTAPAPHEDRIREQAYFRYEQRVRDQVPGKAEDDWVRAAQDLQQAEPMKVDTHRQDYPAS